MKVLYLDESEERCRQMLRESAVGRPDLQILAVSVNDPNLITSAVAKNLDIKVIVINGSVAKYPQQITEIKRFLGKGVQLIGTSDNPDELSALDAAGCEKITGSNMGDVLRLIITV